LETVLERDDLSILGEAVKAADLAEMLAVDGIFTLFAPPDSAFSALGQGRLDALFERKRELIRILTYHIVPGKFMSKDLVSITSLKTLLGQDLSIGISSGITVNNVPVVQADIECSNGVLHRINALLLPQ
jgi:uncharacterized surface protein with fasciclin (FAS1) repeats